MRAWTFFRAVSRVMFWQGEPRLNARQWLEMSIAIWWYRPQLMVSANFGHDVPRHLFSRSEVTEIERSPTERCRRNTKAWWVR
jgi:hypothetical protein